MRGTGHHFYGVGCLPACLPACLPSGITEMRNAYFEKEEAKKLKQKQRDRMSAKTGKMDIAYEVRPSGPMGGGGEWVLHAEGGCAGAGVLLITCFPDPPR